MNIFELFVYIKLSFSDDENSCRLCVFEEDCLTFMILDSEGIEVEEFDEIEVPA